jgi:hypothetical protein
MYLSLIFLFFGIFSPILSQAFILGERLEYKVFWKGMHVGNSVLQVGKELVDQNGTNCMVFKSTARSSPLVAFLFTVDDKILSFYDPESQRTIAGSKQIHEGRFHREYHAEFDYERNTANWWQKQHKGSKESKPNDDTFRSKSGKTRNIPDKTLDVLSALYFFRNHPTPAEFGTFFSIPVYDDLQMTELDMKILDEEIIELEINGKITQIPTIKVRPHLATSGVFQSDGEILIWISNDFRRIPLKVETTMKGKGKVTAEIFSAENLAQPPVIEESKTE